MPRLLCLAPLLVVAALPTASRAFGGRGTRSLGATPVCTSSRLLDASSSPSSASDASLGRPICVYKTITVQPSGMREGEHPRQAVSVEDLTPHLQSFLAASGMQNGAVHVISRHTTTAITINERESRLAQDVEDFFLQICPPDERSSSAQRREGVRYLHNDINQRPDGEEEAKRCRDNGWDIDNPQELQRWRDQEPINAHSHLISMMVGSSECIPVVDGEMVIGQWQRLIAHASFTSDDLRTATQPE